MNRQEKVKQITLGIIIAISGLLLIFVQKIPFIQTGLSIIFIILGLFQFKDKKNKTALMFLGSGALFYFIYPLLNGSLFILGILLIIGGGIMAFKNWNRDS